MISQALNNRIRTSLMCFGCLAISTLIIIDAVRIQNGKSPKFIKLKNMSERNKMLILINAYVGASIISIIGLFLLYLGIEGYIR